MRRRHLTLTVLWGVTGPALTLIMLFLFSEPLQKLELQTCDIRTRLVGPSSADDRVIIILIDDPSLAQLGPWPWPRGLHGDLIRRLHSLGAEFIVYDILFATPGEDPAQDNDLLAAMRETQKVIFPLALQLEPYPAGSELAELSPESWKALKPFFLEFEPNSVKVHPPCAVRARMPLSDMISAASGVGHNASTPDTDGVFRRVPLMARVRDKIIPPLGFSAIAQLGMWDTQQMMWDGRELVIPPTSSSQGVSALRIPLDHEANLIINWAGPWNSITNFSARWLLDPSPPQDIQQEMQKRIKGSVCIVGAGFTGGGDIGPQPFQTDYLLVGLHANMINTLLSGRFLVQSERVAVILYLLFLSLIAICLGLFRRPWVSTLAGILVIIGYILYSFVALVWQNTFIPVIAPEIAFIISFVSITLYRLSRESLKVRFLRDHLGHTLPRTILDQLIENPDSINLQSERREVTVLFSDIVGFTSISDKEEPEIVYDLLTEYFEAMTRIIFKHGGTIDKFMGDGILAFWGAPIPAGNSALPAVRAAAEMQSSVRKLNVKWKHSGWPVISIRIGINTGYVSVGFFGSPLRREYTVLGSNVNMGQRLESNCRPGNVLVDRRTYALVKDEFQALSLGKIDLKGFADKIEVYEIECSEPGTEAQEAERDV